MKVRGGRGQSPESPSLGAGIPQCSENPGEDLPKRWIPQVPALRLTQQRPRGGPRNLYFSKSNLHPGKSHADGEDPSRKTQPCALACEPAGSLHCDLLSTICPAPAAGMPSALVAARCLSAGIGELRCVPQQGGDFKTLPLPRRCCSEPAEGEAAEPSGPTGTEEFLFKKNQILRTAFWSSAYFPPLPPVCR